MQPIQQPTPEAAVSHVIRTDARYDVPALQREVELVRQLASFDEGPYKNAISLPAAEQVPAPFRTHHNSVPFTGVLDRCPHLKRVFDSFQTEKVAFRLLRRLAGAAYSFHDDKDRGRDIARFQIPINTSEHAFLLIAHDGLDLARFDVDGSGFKGDANRDLWFDMTQLHAACADQVDLYYLEPGCLNYFDTDRVHTLINAAPQERVTLSIDLVMNDWLERWMRENLTIAVPPSPIVPSATVRWKWNALRRGILRTD